ncbi:MAG: hypothetical protein KIT56_07295 [Gammaproteobacteria bacterium]|nr:hypothetical protein [Gammaproteobacteria bacterium]MCW5583665.1 hypothetical protein [Gammaproteobacteria bacterium]
MEIKITTSKLVSIMMIIFIVSYFTLTSRNAYAGYLIQPAPGPFIECIQYCKQQPKAKKHHQHTNYKHRKHKYYSHCYAYAPCKKLVYAACCPDFHKGSNTIIEFNSAPDAYGSGRYVDTYEYDYDPDLSTGDDDPTTYPGMNIDR